MAGQGHSEVGPAHVPGCTHKDALLLQVKTQQRGLSSYRAAGPGWDARATKTEGYRSEFSCSTVWHRFSTINKKSHLILVRVLLLLTMSENCVLLPLLSPRTESCMCLKVSRFTPWQTDGECRDITFSYTPRQLLSPDAKYVLFSKQHVLYNIKHAKFHEHLSMLRVG